MNTIRNERGFTLIELLVVIAIIGILSAVVLSSLNTARGRGRDAAVKSNLSSLRSQAEIFNSENDYAYAGGGGIITAGAACPTSQPTNTSTNYSLMGDPTFYKGIDAARGVSGSFCSYITGSTYWAVSVQLKDQSAKAWCIDSTGKAGIVAAGNIVTGTTQPIMNGTVTTAGCGL